MRRSQPSLLLHPLFIISLLLLIANDHWWKYEYHNWFTGKLSDVAGLFVFQLFLNSLFPGKKWVTALITTSLFIWWKSPLSDSFINALQQLTLPVHRVTDYTDLFALVMLPLANLLKPFNFKNASLPNLVKPVVYLFTFFAICATSMYRMPCDYPGYRVSLNKSYNTSLTEDLVFKKLDSLQFNYRLDSVEVYPAYIRDYAIRIQKPNDSTVEWKTISNSGDTALFCRCKQYFPFYVIDQLPFESETLKNLKFRISDKGRKREIEIMSVDVPDDFNYYRFTQGPTYRKLKKDLKKLLAE